MKSTQEDVDFIRYMAENFASFDYKTQEEVLTVAKALTSVLSTTGMQLVEQLAPSHLLSQLHEDAMSVEQADHGIEQLPLLRCSVIIGMVMLLKAHLKWLYGLSEESVNFIVVFLAEVDLDSSKCAKWVIGKKTAVGDKAAARRTEQAVSWDRLPFATKPIITSQDMVEQREVVSVLKFILRFDSYVLV